MEKAIDPLFLDLATVVGLHSAQMVLFGNGPAALLDHGLLESAVIAPQNLWLYDNESDIFDLAASYCAHIAWNHPFEDGNKRTALSAALHFLSINGLDPALRGTCPEEVRIVDEFLAGAVLALVQKSTPESSFSETLFYTIGLSHISDAVHESLESLRVRQFKSKDEMEAYITDMMMCGIVKSLMDRCQRFCINSKRYARLEAGIREDVVSKVAPKYQLEFGMVVTDDVPESTEPDSKTPPKPS